MTDSAGKRSENIGIELLDEGKKDRCAIRITPDEEWLKDPERVYPVIVDPITTTSKDVKEIIDACVDSQDAAGTDREGMYLKTRGGDIIQRSYLKFKLPMIKTGDMVINARMLMVSLAKDGKERTVQVHRVLQDWDSANLTWMNKPMYSETVEDICKFTGDEQKYISLDITRLVKEWYQNGRNYGVLLRDSYELSGYTAYLSSDCDSDYTNMRPRIDISYVNYSGLEDYWTYHSQEAGRAGTVYVNDYNGNVIMQHNTMETGGSLMPMGLTQVYNSNDKDTDIGYGYGVRLNYHQTIRKITIAGTEYYKHTDGDGTVHYFVYDSTKKKWKEETGLELELILKTGDSDIAYVIKDKEEQPLDTNLVKTYLNYVNALNLGTYVTYNTTDEELAKYGLDEPQYNLEVKYTPKSEDSSEDSGDSTDSEAGSSEKTFILHVSAKQDDKAYVRIGDSKIIYEITEDEYKNVTDGSYDSLRHKSVVTADLSDVDSVKVTLEDKDYTIDLSEKKGDVVSTYDGEEIEGTDFTDALKALKASDFTSEEPSEKEEISFTLHYKDDKYPEKEVKIYRYDGTNCLVTIDGKSISLVKRDLVVDLTEAVNAIVLK